MAVLGVEYRKNMPVLINFKICDNSKDCSGIEVCPTDAFYWDDKKKTIAVNDKECIACGKCERACPVGAIRVARNESEYRRIKKEIKNDHRKISDLFVDRYGADSVSPAFLIPPDKFDIQIIQSNKLAAVEFFSNSSIKCLLYSIPIKDLFKNINLKYRKIKVEESNPILKRYKIKQLPTLAFFNKGKIIAKIEGYYPNYPTGEKKIFMEKVNKIISKVK